MRGERKLLLKQGQSPGVGVNAADKFYFRDLWHDVFGPIAAPEAHANLHDAQRVLSAFGDLPQTT